MEVTHATGHIALPHISLDRHYLHWSGERCGTSGNGVSDITWPGDQLLKEASDPLDESKARFKGL